MKTSKNPRRAELATTLCHVARGLVLVTLLAATGIASLPADDPASPPPPPGSECCDFGCEK